MNELLEFNALSAIKAARDRIKEVVNLELDEIQKMLEFKTNEGVPRATARLQIEVRDLYIFQCFTGLSYADLGSFKLVDKNGALWIENRRLKNDNYYLVPVFEEAKEILNKYSGILPAVTNQTYNRVIKIVAGKCGIAKNLSTHTARKTFATLMDQRGVSTKSISDMLGNTLVVCERHYLAKSPQRIENELLKLGILSRLTS